MVNGTLQVDYLKNQLCILAINCQLANQLPEHDMIIPGDTIFNPGLDNTFSAVLAPCSTYLEMVEHPMAECLPDENQNCTEP
ncbi:hypothetical protein BDZ91DRAFT_511523 [Kalaharituber pfeilii]|nr:hypothetical protein BDZ91DRAFT_511523 [Kalaharituber pfeilii]